jgi:hypothetical protein
MHQVSKGQCRVRITLFFFIIVGLDSPNDFFDTFLTFVAIYMSTMSETKDDSKDLEEAQKNQKKPGAAENDPETTGPAENLREEAAEMVDEDSDEKDSV